MTLPGPPRPHRPLGVRLGLAGLLLLPLVELTVAILVGRAIGAGPTVAVLIALSVAGVVVLRRAGGRAMRALAPGSSGTAPSDHQLAEAGDAAWTLLGGLLLVVPGFVTALVGVLLVLNPTRRVLRPVLGRGAGLLAGRVIGVPLVGRMSGTRVVRGDVVEATVVDVQVTPQPPSPEPPPRVADRPFGQPEPPAPPGQPGSSGDGPGQPPRGNPGNHHPTDR